jgi:hypothetical protein
VSDEWARPPFGGLKLSGWVPQAIPSVMVVLIFAGRERWWLVRFDGFLYRPEKMRLLGLIGAAEVKNSFYYFISI